MSLLDDDRRVGCLLVAAAQGYHRAARGLIGRAIRTALGVKRWQTTPHYVCYYPTHYEGTSFVARYTLHVTDEEWRKVNDEIFRLAEEEGWSQAPVDGYHDPTHLPA